MVGPGRSGWWLALVILKVFSDLDASVALRCVAFAVQAFPLEMKLFVWLAPKSSEPFKLSAEKL